MRDAVLDGFGHLREWVADLLVAGLDYAYQCLHEAAPGRAAVRVERRFAPNYWRPSDR